MIFANKGSILFSLQHKCHHRVCNKILHTQRNLKCNQELHIQFMDQMSNKEVLMQFHPTPHNPCPTHVSFTYENFRYVCHYQLKGVFPPGQRSQIGPVLNAFRCLVIFVLVRQ
ncbi:hypothetical protein CLF_113296 [Clonorchis sinensis]|uniref:Uncharacterized protein n=1 Tax=Clonorchis sinensis TaxID=79923 RepID=G7YY42_CLOSI|nr:hypothetical protein CLF_113296 [Clonorchis sinensis]